jgi:hypothetical protein
MVSIAPNWTRITGTIRASRTAGAPEGRVDLEVEVDSAGEVEGFRSFLSDAAGTTLVVSVPVEVADSSGLKPGRMLRARVRRGKQRERVFAHTREIDCWDP